jgi:hypothetical protein
MNTLPGTTLKSTFLENPELELAGRTLQTDQTF